MLCLHFLQRLHCCTEYGSITGVRSRALTGTLDSWGVSVSYGRINLGIRFRFVDSDFTADPRAALPVHYPLEAATMRGICN